MSNITIDGNKTSVFDAITWCSEKFGSEWGGLKNTFPSNMWQFEFKDSRKAMMFALTWS